MPIDRKELDTNELLSSFYEKNNIATGTKLRLSGMFYNYDRDPRGTPQWVSESYMTSQGLLGMLDERELFLGDTALRGARSVELEDLHS